MTDSVMPPDAATTPLADEVSRTVSINHTPLDSVGMRGIEMPVQLSLDGRDVLLPARVSVAVDLCEPSARGIHMSRLYRLCNEYLTTSSLDLSRLRTLMDALLHSHAGLSRRARLELAFEVPVLRPALRSTLSGWRQYPIRIRCERDGSHWRCELGAEILYSSTCPGSAAMARQVVAEQFRQTFGQGQVDSRNVADWLESEAGGAATAHAQRSLARVEVALAEEGAEQLPVLALIDAVEEALKTAVQGAVKRVDEQEFARLNGANPQYCEDAARRIQKALSGFDWICDYRIEAAHLESLHPHDAVAQVTKGVPGGFVC